MSERDGDGGAVPLGRGRCCGPRAFRRHHRAAASVPACAGRRNGGRTRCPPLCPPTHGSSRLRHGLGWRDIGGAVPLRIPLGEMRLQHRPQHEQPGKAERHRGCGFASTKKQPCTPEPEKALDQALVPVGGWHTRLGFAFTRAGGQAPDEAAVTNPITLSRNSSDPSPQPEAPAGPCARTTEAEVPTGLPPNTHVLRKENSSERLFYPPKRWGAHPGHQCWDEGGTAGLHPPFCSEGSSSPAQHVATSPQGLATGHSPIFPAQGAIPPPLLLPGEMLSPLQPLPPPPPQHSTGRAIPKTSGPPLGCPCPHKGTCTFGVWSELKNQVRNRSSVRSSPAPRVAAGHPGAPSTLQGPTRTKIVLCSTCTNGNLTAHPGCETAPPPR